MAKVTVNISRNTFGSEGMRKEVKRVDVEITYNGDFSVDENTLSSRLHSSGLTSEESEAAASRIACGEWYTCVRDDGTYVNVMW